MNIEDSKITLDNFLAFTNDKSRCQNVCDYYCAFLNTKFETEEQLKDAQKKILGMIDKSIYMIKYLVEEGKEKIDTNTLDNFKTMQKIYSVIKKNLQ